MPAKLIAKKLLWLVHPDDTCLVSSSYLYRNSLGMGKSPT